MFIIGEGITLFLIYQHTKKVLIYQDLFAAIPNLFTFVITSAIYVQKIEPFFMTKQTLCHLMQISGNYKLRSQSVDYIESFDMCQGLLNHPVFPITIYIKDNFFTFYSG